MAASRLSMATWARAHLSQHPPRSKSLIITLFGDSLLPYVDGIWMGDLVELLQPFGVNAQLVRTSCFRLAEEGWLTSQREGRSSRYTLTASGKQRVEAAYSRIYSPPLPRWDGQWTVVIPWQDGAAAGKRTALRHELEWAGFGRISARLFVHPRADLAALREAVGRLGLAQETVVFRAREVKGWTGASAALLSAQCWDLETVAADYTRFLQQFKPLLPKLQSEVPPQAAFLIQTLLIHAFRRVVLHDPRLPAALLPHDWPGHAAYTLCRAIYLHTFAQCRTHLIDALKLQPQNSLRTSRSVNARFGGLTRNAKD